MRKSVSLVYEKKRDWFYAAPIHKPLPQVYWELLAPIDKSPSSLLHESPRLAQKKSVGYHPMIKCKQAIIDSHCCCAEGGGARQSPHPDGRGSHRTPSHLKVTPCAHTFARTFGTKPNRFWHVFTHGGTLQWHHIGHAEHRVQYMGCLADNIHNDKSHCSRNTSMAFATLSKLNHPWVRQL